MDCRFDICAIFTAVLRIIVLTVSPQWRAPAHICQSTIAPVSLSPLDLAEQNLQFHLFGHLWPSQTALVGYWPVPA